MSTKNIVFWYIFGKCLLVRFEKLYTSMQCVKYNIYKANHNIFIVDVCVQAKYLTNIKTWHSACINCYFYQ